MQMKVKPIFNSFLAKQLLAHGNKIIDLQKNRNLKNATVFIFEDTQKLHDDIGMLTTK
jgi:hypothetical protein